MYCNDATLIHESSIGTAWVPHAVFCCECILVVVVVRDIMDSSIRKSSVGIILCSIFYPPTPEIKTPVTPEA